MISANELVDLLEEKDLVPEDLIAILRAKVAESATPSAGPPWNKPITAARLAKWLVDNGHLSRLLAQRLLAKAEGQPEPSPAPTSREATKQPASRPPSDDLGFAPLEGEEAAKPVPTKKTEPAMKRKPPPPKPKSTGGVKSPPEKDIPVAAPVDASLLDDEPLQTAGPVASGGAPLEPLVEASLLDPALANAPLELVTPRKRRFFGRGKKDNVWDSTLLLVGGGSLLGLLILGGVLFWVLGRQNSDEMLKVANDFYQQGSYTNAILNYDRFLEKFPDDAGASMARVRRGLAQLRQATDNSSNWSEALATATEVTGQISSETEFAAEGRPELAALLPKIAEGLVGKARDELSPEYVQQTEDALALVDKYVPASQQPTTRLQDIEGILALAKRQIAQGQKLNKATAAMLAAVGQGNTQEAYKIRNELLRNYPRLIDNEQLREAVLAVTRAEQSAVKMVAKETPAETTEPASTAISVVALANRRGEKPVSGVDGRVVFAMAEGAAYGLEASTGKVLWRRQIGFATSPSGPEFPPTPVDEKAGSDVLLVDNDRNEVIRVEATTGKLRWRHPVGEPLDAHPALAGGRVLVATRSGRIIEIDLESGASPRYAQLQQPLSVAPAVDMQRSRIYQLAEHSNLFVLSMTDGSAIQTVYLGHERGAITAPPIIASRYLVIAENDRASGGVLRVLSLEAEGDGPPVRILQEVRVDGQIDTQPLVSGVRVLVVTDQSDIYLFQISGSNAEAPLTEVARGKAADVAPMAGGMASSGMFRFPLIVGSQVWIADSQLSRYDIQPSKGRLEPRGIENESSVTLQPPVPVGRLVVHVRRQIGLPGVLVSAMPLDGGRAVWETQLAAPLVAEPVVDETSGHISAISQLGAAFQFDRNVVKGRSVVDEPAASLSVAEVRHPLTDSVPVDKSLVVLAATDGPKLIPVLDLADKPRFRWVTLPESLGCPPVGFAGGLLAPCRHGQALLLDPKSGKPLAEPFQPRLETGTAVDWRAAARISDDQAILADGRRKIYRIGVGKEPKPHLAQLGEVPLDAPLAAPVAVLDKVVYAVDEANSLLAFKLPDLTAEAITPLGGRVVWGPQLAGDCVLLATDEQHLWCLDGEQQVRWKVELPFGVPTGKPLVADGGLILSTTGGVVWRINSATGEQLGKVDTGYPLATGPVALGDRLLIGGHDGSLYEIDKP